MNDIIKKLKKISAAANAQVVNINYGGCAVMASLVGSELEKRGIPVEGIVPYGKPAQARNNLKVPHKVNAWKWEENGINFNHVAVRFKIDGAVYTYDTDALSRGSMKFGENLRYKSQFKFGGGFKVKELKKIAGTADYWNKDFNRRDIAKLRKIVKEVFNEQ